ncbi:MAG: ParB/RepB/Spo0J family partition protein [Lachnospiraceae bacterium]|nr:ParB/RepB/Spo0J family partition protein [Lachnospiraceae bacterium]
MAARRGGLGKGLDSLIPDTNPTPLKENTKVVEKIVEKVVEKSELCVKISKVGPNRDQPRKQFNEDALQELADSIKQFGVLQPLLVQEKNGFYEIIAGERRWRAAKIAGIKEIPVIVKEYTDLEIIEIALIENIQREDLNPIEEALAYKRLINEFQLKQDEVAERVSKSRTAVTNSMRLLKLDQRVQQMVIDDMLSTGHARALLGIEDGELQAATAAKVFDEKLSVREVEKLVKQMQKEKPEKREEKQDLQFLYADLEEKMKGAIGTKVSIRQKAKNKGKIEIEYYSREDLERIIDMITAGGKDSGKSNI